MKSSHGLVKSVIELDHFGLHFGQNVRVTMEFEVPKKRYIKAYIIHWHDPTGFVVGDTKEVLQ